jgi:D-3-phosphoglycerate dehydrogenase
VRILIADAFSESHVARLRSFGHEVVHDPSLTAADLPAAVPGHDALVVRSTRVTEEAIAAGDRLSLVVRAGAGVNTIDVAAAASRGVVVSNTPGKNAVAVAELTMGLICAIDRNIADNVAELRDGVWNKKRWSQADGLAGKTIGIVGFGAIGVEVAARARAFAMDVVIIDKPGRSPELAAAADRLDCRLVPDLETLVRHSDVITFHVPAAAETAAMVNRDLLSHVRPGTVIVNTSRGDIVDEEALLEAIEEKDLRVGLDVFADEPATGRGEFTSRLGRHPAVYGTHHIGASTRQAQQAIADEVVRIVDDFGRGAMRNAVNLAEEPLGETAIAVRHYDRVGVLAQVLELLRRADLNVEQMTNTVFAGAEAASATIHLSAMPAVATLEAIERIEDVIAVSGGSLAGLRPSIRPFVAYLPRPDLAEEVAAPPLSSITADRYQRLVADNPLSILHVLHSAIDTIEGIPEAAAGSEEEGAARLADLLDRGVLVPQSRDAFYVYRVAADSGSHVGLVAEVAAAGLDEGTIRPHEDTRRETEGRVLEHLRAVRAHTDPVAMAHRTDPALAALLQDVVETEAPLLDFEADDGARQQLWVVDDRERMGVISARLATIDRLYITDGHHRTTATRRFAAERAAANPDHTGTEAYNYLPAVLFAEDQLGLDGYHRCLRDLGARSAADFLEDLRRGLRVEELSVPWAEEARPRRSGLVGMLLDGRWYRIDLPEPRPASTEYERLDAVLLQEHVLGPLLGVVDPRRDERLQYIPGPAGLGEFVRRNAAVGFALHPPTARAVMAVADAGMVMPPKSTWFEPKVRAGIVVRRV